jgi:hypothetical protein
MNFKELVGKEVGFYGVDNETFKVDEHVFQAIEDPDDGYRSYLGSIKLKSSDGLNFFRQPIARVKIVGTLNDNFDGYKFVDVNNGHIWLEIGTDHNDDYYPYFVFSYKPDPQLVAKKGIQNDDSIVANAAAGQRWTDADKFKLDTYVETVYKLAHSDNKDDVELALVYADRLLEKFPELIGRDSSVVGINEYPIYSTLEKAMQIAQNRLKDWGKQEISEMKKYFKRFLN